MPASACLSALTICSSVYLLFRMSPILHGWAHVSPGPLSGGKVTASSSKALVEDGRSGWAVVARQRECVTNVLRERHNPPRRWGAPTSHLQARYRPAVGRGSIGQTAWTGHAVG